MHSVRPQCTGGFQQTGLGARERTTRQALACKACSARKQTTCCVLRATGMPDTPRSLQLHSDTDDNPVGGTVADMGYSSDVSAELLKIPGPVASVSPSANGTAQHQKLPRSSGTACGEDLPGSDPTASLLPCQVTLGMAQPPHRPQVHSQALPNWAALAFLQVHTDVRTVQKHTLVLCTQTHSHSTH